MLGWPEANQNSAEQQSRSILVRMIKMLSLITFDIDLLDPPGEPDVPLKSLPLRHRF
jgi:hypothetical protein